MKMSDYINVCCCDPEYSFGQDYYKSIGTTNCTDRCDTRNHSFMSLNSSNKNNETKGTAAMEMFNNIFGKIQNGMCRLSMDGNIAVKTSNGYKAYDVKAERLTNCSDFVFNVGEEFFFVIPTNKVHVGDIVLISGKPKCVIETHEKTIVVINYEDSTVETILPERHIFLGNAYFYGKIVTMFGNDILKDNSEKKTKKLMNYMMMMEMMRGNSNPGNSNVLYNMLPLMLTNAFGFSDAFKDMFSFDEGEESYKKEEAGK